MDYTLSACIDCLDSLSYERKVSLSCRMCCAMMGNCYMTVRNCYGSAYYAARSVWSTFLHLLQIGWQSTALKVLLYDGKSAVLLVFFFSFSCSCSLFFQKQEVVAVCLYVLLV